MTQSLAGPTVRTATTTDAAAVRRIDSACFPPGDLDREPAPPGELEAAVEVGDVRILEVGDQPVAYLHADRTRTDRIYISGVGVLPSMQRLGLGSKLIDDCLATLDPRLRAAVPIVTITSPRNLVMLRVICARGFRGRRILRSYFGPGRDRLGCQLSVTGRSDPADRLLRIPAASVNSLDELYRVIDAGAHTVQGVGRGPGGSAFYEVAGVDPDDYPPPVRFRY